MKIVSTLMFVGAFFVGCNDAGVPFDTGDPGMDGTVDPPDADEPAEVSTDPNALPDGAPNPCIGSTSCDDCTSRTPCGWCNGMCLAGTESGSFNGTCSGTAWMWRGVQCPGVGAQCPSHADCSSCAMDPDGCGWCTNVRRCVGGDATGPGDTSIQGCSSAAGTWIYNLQTMTCR